MGQQSRANLLHSVVSRQLLLNQPSHAGVGCTGLLGIFKSPFRVERGERRENAAASFMDLILQLGGKVEAADGSGIELSDLRVGLTQVINDESADTNDRYADCQAGQGKAVPLPE